MCNAEKAPICYKETEHCKRISAELGSLFHPNRMNLETELKPRIARIPRMKSGLHRIVLSSGE